MATIESYNPEEMAKISDRIDTEIRELAKRMAKDADYSLLAEMCRDMADDDELMKLLMDCIFDKMIGKHPDCFELGKEMTKYGAKFIHDKAEAAWDD